MHKNINQILFLFFSSNMMNFFACQSVTLERECGTIAMDVYVNIVQRIGPGVVAGCENSYDLLPAAIRIYKLIEEEEEDIYSGFKEVPN